MNEQATRAQASQGSERRRTPRVALDLLIQYRFESYEAFLGDRSLDISAGGIFICTEAPREEGTLVYLQFRLKEGAPLVEGSGASCASTRRAFQAAWPAWASNSSTSTTNRARPSRTSSPAVCLRPIAELWGGILG